MAAIGVSRMGLRQTGIKSAATQQRTKRNNPFAWSNPGSGEALRGPLGPPPFRADPLGWGTRQKSLRRSMRVPPPRHERIESAF